MTNRNTQPSGAMRMLNVRVESAVLDRFREVAEADHRTVSQELRRLIDLRIAEARQATDKAAA